MIYKISCGGKTRWMLGISMEHASRRFFRRCSHSLGVMFSVQRIFGEEHYGLTTRILKDLGMLQE